MRGYVVVLAPLIGLVCVCVLAVRKKKRYGIPLLVVLLLTVGVAAALVHLRPRPRTGRDYSHVEMLGALLAPHLPPQANVLLLMTHPAERLLGYTEDDEMMVAWLGPPATTLEEWIQRESAAAGRALERGAGIRVNILGNRNARTTPQSFNDALAPFEHREVDLVVSVYCGGLPLSGPAPGAAWDGRMAYAVEDLVFFNWRRVPMLAVADLPAASGVYDREQLRDLLQRGLLSAVVLNVPGSATPRTAVSAHNLDVLP